MNALSSAQILLEDGSSRTKCERWGVVYHFEPGEQPAPTPLPPVTPPAPNP